LGLSWCSVIIVSVVDPGGPAARADAGGRVTGLRRIVVGVVGDQAEVRYPKPSRPGGGQAPLTGIILAAARVVAFTDAQCRAAVAALSAMIVRWLRWSEGPR
jgi:hypothetical protein